MKTFKEIKKGDKIYKQECWIKNPMWNDIKVNEISRNSNSELIIEMEKNLKNFK